VADAIVAQLTPLGAQARGLSVPPPPRRVWTKEPYPEDAAMQYGFTKCVRRYCGLQRCPCLLVCT
jgi:hypothetical protein